METPTPSTSSDYQEAPCVFCVKWARENKKRKRAERMKIYRANKRANTDGLNSTDQFSAVTSTVAKRKKAENQRRYCAKKKAEAEAARQKNAETGIAVPIQPDTSAKIKRKRLDSARKKTYRANKRARMDLTAIIEHPNDEDPILALQKLYDEASKEFKVKFSDDEFGHPCNVCDRLWFHNDLFKVPDRCLNILEAEFPEEDVQSFQSCSTCKGSLLKGTIPQMSRSNGYTYQKHPDNLPELDCISERLISPRLPFMQIRRLRWSTGSQSIIGQVINVPVDVNKMVKELPRCLDDDRSFNVHIKRSLMHKSTYLEGYVQKSTIKQWLSYLVDTPLYRLYNINIDQSFFGGPEEHPARGADIIEPLDIHGNDNEYLLAQQQTLMWSEDKYLCVAPGQNNRPYSLVFDEHAEELSFPAIYFGHPRRFKEGVRVTPFSMATSEIRRRDRRGVKPDHILYMAMKIMRLRISQGMSHTFKSSTFTTEITREMLEDRAFVDSCLDTNLAFLKSIPNSANYWADRKKDLFAMIRQLGKPTVFLTLSANEPRWPQLIKILYKLRENVNFDGSDEDILRLSALKRTALVNEDPVTCVIYFNKLVDVLLKILSSEKHSPFGKYRVLDSFKRIEFQHRGSPHAHILLWLENDPKEEIGENMPETIKLIDSLCAVDAERFLEHPGNQKHKHTFTCFKKNDKRCRFGAPFWPMKCTKILIPMPKEDGRRQTMSSTFKLLHTNLEETSTYASINDFWAKNGIKDEEHYFNIIRAGISRPMVMLKRDISQIWINSFNPWIGPILNSNMDLQFILDEYSCAVYVAEYVNKTNRGISALQRELIKLREEYPDKDYIDLLKEVAIKLLNNVEMSSQEAAWYLLRLGMSEASRQVAFIPTMWPEERYKVPKTRKQLDEEELDESSTDIWRENIIQKYERRPSNLSEVTLAQFTANYYFKPKTKTYELRQHPKILRYRNYDMTVIKNYKREMVTLHVPFANEAVQLLDCEKFIQIYDNNETLIVNRRKEFESNIDIQKTIDHCRELCLLEDEQTEHGQEDPVHPTNSDVLQRITNNDDDIRCVNVGTSVVRKRNNLMSAEEYCAAMQHTNREQREIILEAIYRLFRDDHGSEPLQIFLTGPAGCGKTYVLKLLMETINRFSRQHNNSSFNSYVACASTGKAATAIGGTTVHSAFRISLSRVDHGLSHESLQTLRNSLRHIEAVFVDEISMIGAQLLETLNSRLQQINLNFDTPFGGFNIVFCGDLRQLPPVMSTPIYKRMRRSLNNEVLWQSLKYFPLIQVVRQSDVSFSTILTKIGNGDKLSLEETTVIESRFVNFEDIQSRLPKAIRLFLKNADVAEYNSEVVSNHDSTIENVAIDMYSGQKNQEQLTSMRAKVHKMKITETAGLPYIVRFLLGLPYMITANIDVSDGLINGSLGILMYVEFGEEEGDGIKRVWLKFEDPKTGMLARTKCKFPCGLVEESATSWVPISRRSTNISFKTRTLTCKRLQFPLVEASALTIHKSQGGTYESVVYEYHKSHDQQLVYVALSRATSLEGLYLTNKGGDFKFHHSKGRVNVELRNEFKRLENHQLLTVTSQCEALLTTSNIQNNLSLVTLNVQSLKAHVNDLVTDSVFPLSRLLALTETWVSNEEYVPIQGFRRITQCKRDNVRAGGVAVYENTSQSQQSKPHTLQAHADYAERILNVREPCGDICAVECIVQGQRILVVTTYLSPNTSFDDIKLFLLKNLLLYTPGQQHPELEEYGRIPVVLTGDFNIDVSGDKHPEFVKFMEETFGLTLMNDRNSSTTRGGTCIDLVFSRSLSVSCRNYITYFSYHKPILSITHE